MLLGLKMHGLVYIFKKVMSKSKCVENHFMDNYIYSLKKYDLWLVLNILYNNKT